MKIKVIKKLLISVIIGLIFLELSIRAGMLLIPTLMPSLYLGGAHPRNLIIPDREIGYLLNPNFKGEETNDYKEYRISVKISPQGLRDYEHNLSKKTYRILGIGDSYTFGEGVELKDTYLSVLENKLKEKYGPENIEIIKAGIPGYGTKQEIMFLKRHISVFKPEIVIMGLLPKEAFRSENPYTYCHGYIVDSKKIDQLYLVNGKIYSARTKNRFFGKLTAVMKHYYITPQFIQSRIKNLRKRFKKSQVQEENFNSPDYLQKKYALTFSLLKEYKEICLTHGARPVIVLIEGNPIEDNFIIQFTKAIGIPTLSLYPAFKELDDKQITYHFPRDLHWNTTGHKVAAETILDFLISLRII